MQYNKQPGTDEKLFWKRRHDSGCDKKGITGSLNYKSELEVPVWGACYFYQSNMHFQIAFAYFIG